MTAKAHGMEDKCKLLLDACGVTEDQVTLPTIGKPTQPPRIIVPTHQANWPVKAASHTFFEKALLGEVEGLDEPGAAATNGVGDDDGLHGEAAQDGLRGDIEEEDDAAAGWDMGDDLNVEVESELVAVAGADAGAAGGGNSEADQWTRNSPIAADHVAGGAFESAMALLHRQVGAVHFEPLRPRFMEIYRASRTFLPATAGLPPLVNHVRRTVEETDVRKVLPAIPRDLDALAAHDLQEGHAAMKANRLEDCQRIFRRILHALLVNAVGGQTQVAEAKKLIATAGEYVLAVAIELERRTTSEETEDGIKRGLELAAYFTIPKLEVVHRQLALMAALRVATKHKNYSSALSFANRVIANGVVAKHVDQVRAFCLPPVNAALLSSAQCFVRFNSPLLTFRSPMCRPRRSRPSARRTRSTRCPSNSTPSPSSTYARPRTRPSTAACPRSRAPSTAPGTTSGRRARCAGCARCARSVHRPAGCGCGRRRCEVFEM